MDSNKKYHYLTLEERIKIEIYRKEGFSITAIADKINRHKSTVSREICRNLVKQRKSDLTERMDYYSDFAHKQYQKRKLASGAKLKLTKCHEAITYIEDKIINDKWLPDAAVGRYKLENTKSLA